MSYTPGYQVTIPPMVSVYTRGIGWVDESFAASAPASSIFESGNRAVYVPIILNAGCVVRRVWWANGATVSATYNVDCGVYADDGFKPGVRLVSSGSTAQGTASQVQFADVTDTALAPGLYWIALTCSSTSATFLRSLQADNVDAPQRFNEDSALPLPATATPAEASGSAIWLCGFATTASP